MEQTKVLPKFDFVSLGREKTLIIGAGQIGKSLGEVLSQTYNVFFQDIDVPKFKENRFRVINICYPYSEKFIKITKKYLKKYKPQLTIIHSTVKVGTTRKLGKNIVHSPINGRHPDLIQAIKIFTKFIGGNDVYSTFEAVTFLNRAGIKTQVFSSSESTELGKLLCTRRYGLSIMEMKETIRLCENFNVPFTEVYTEWNNHYNEGYLNLKELRFIRPNLFPLLGPIGGHCVIPNCDLLPNDFLSQILKGRNKTYGIILEQPAVGAGKISKTEDKSLSKETISVSSKKSRKAYKDLRS